MILAPRWKKLMGDVCSTQGRMAMMIGALAIGIFGVGTILSAYTILTREISANYLATHPASATIELNQVDDALLKEVRHRPGIAYAEPDVTVTAKVEVKPDEWLPILLFVVPDFNAMRINTFKPESGAWPPRGGSVLLERAALQLVNAKIGQSIQMQTPTGTKRSVVISGLVHDPGLAPAWQEQTVYGYVTPATLAALGVDVTPHRLKISVSDQSFDIRVVEHTVTELAAWLKQRGYTVGEIHIPPPGKHPHQTQMTAILTMLLIFSIMALILSAILTATMIGGLLAQQVRQIGVMKAIGARTWQIANIYLVLVTATGCIALVLGLPAGVAAGRVFAVAIAELLNFTIHNDAIPHWVYLIQIMAGVLLPLLVTLVPIYRATKTTVREAINDFGVRRQTTRSRHIDAILGKMRGFDRTLVLSMRNIFRRMGRLAMTLGLLAAAGAMFMTSLNVKSAWEKNLADATADRHYDLEIRMVKPEMAKTALAIAEAVPGVVKVEPWNIASAAADRSDGLEIEKTYPDGGHGGFTLRSVPPGSALITLTQMSGRWLQAQDTDAVVLNHAAQALFPTARVGDVINLRVNGRLSGFHVVGIAREIITPATAYTTPDAFASGSGLSEQLNAVRVVMKEHDDKSVAAVTTAIRHALEKNNVMTGTEISESRLGGALSGHVYILIYTLIMMSLLMAIVGVLGLMSNMGTSVLERTREFGIMRTIGARTNIIVRNVLGEGLFIGLISWAIAIVLSIPLSAGVGRLIGMLSFRLPLPLFLSPAAMFMWLLLIILGSIVASAYPALKASRLTIRETLIYI